MAEQIEKQDTEQAEEPMRFVTDADWKVNLADECFEKFFETGLLLLDEEKREIRYSDRGLEMLKEIEASCIRDNEYDYLNALMIAMSYIGIMKNSGNGKFSLTDEGVAYAENLLIPKTEEGVYPEKKTQNLVGLPEVPEQK